MWPVQHAAEVARYGVLEERGGERQVVPSRPRAKIWVAAAFRSTKNVPMSAGASCASIRRRRPHRVAQVERDERPAQRAVGGR